MSFDPSTLLIRPNTSDEGTWCDVFDEDKAYHRPPKSVVNPSVIVDLGANVGYTAIDFSVLFPDAVVLAFEPCEENYRVLKQNILVSGLEYKIISCNAAVSNWTGIGWIKGDHSNMMMLGDQGQEVSVININVVVAVGVDYLKVDIEGSEIQIFKSEGWADKVKCVKAELHGDYYADEAISDLMKLGFKAYADDNHPSCVIGER